MMSFRKEKVYTAVHRVVVSGLALSAAVGFVGVVFATFKLVETREVRRQRALALQSAASEGTETDQERG